MLFLKAYQKKSINQYNEVEGGKWWYSDNYLHFSPLDTSIIVDVKNAPFDFDDILVGTPFFLNNQRLYEKDILLIKNFNGSDVLGTILILDNLGTILRINDYNYELKEILFSYDCSLETNEYILNDKDINVDDVVSDMTLMEYIEKVDLFLSKTNKNYLSCDGVSLDETVFIFKTKRAASAFSNKFLNSNDELFSVLKKAYNSCYIDCNAVILN